MPQMQVRQSGSFKNIVWTHAHNQLIALCGSLKWPVINGHTTIFNNDFSRLSTSSPTEAGVVFLQTDWPSNSVETMWRTSCEDGLYKLENKHERQAVNMLIALHD